MEFYTLLKNRHSVREFADKRVESRKIRAIVDAAMSAPSAGNLQSYRVCVVHSQEAKEALVAAAYYQEFLAKAPLLLIFCADLKRAEAKYEQRGFELYATQDATIACAYAQLAAAEEGLGAVWVGGFEPLEASRIIQAGEYEVPVAILAVGYPAGKPRPTPRRAVKDIVREM